MIEDQKMAGTTVEELAGFIGISADHLLQQLKDAGLAFDKISQVVDDTQKATLLSFINQHKSVSFRSKKISNSSNSGNNMPGRSDLPSKNVQVVRRFSKNFAPPAPLVPEPIAIKQEPISVQDEIILQNKIPEVSSELEPLLVPLETKDSSPEEQSPKVEDSPKESPTPPKSKNLKKKLSAKKTEAKKPENEIAGKKINKKQKYPSASLREDEEDSHLRNKRKLKKQRNEKSLQYLAAEESLTHSFAMPTTPVIREVHLPETITVAELANKMSVKAAEVIKKMMALGVMATINQVIDQDTASIVIEEMGHKAKIIKANTVEENLSELIKKGSQSQDRAPVVTIMGHVDHGKTSLLDYIRKTQVANAEAGGITQHIGAYHVETPKGAITFLDTPGHAAFTAMRARGAKATDIVILLVAADDGVKPQTVEAIQHAKAAKVPIIVAINKVDKPGVDIDKVTQELSNHEVVPEIWGGDVMFIPISAKTGQGINELLEAILLQAEVLELTAHTDGAARGVVIESRLDKGRGTIATILIQSGTLYKGDILLAGLEYGKIRALTRDNGVTVDSAGPSIPVEVLGLSAVPHAGEDAIVVPSEKKAREVASFRQGQFRDIKLARRIKSSLEQRLDNIAATDLLKNFNIVLKADVQGSIEAISDSLTSLSNEEIKVTIISSGVGGITESDVHLAIASQGILIGFNVRADSSAKRLAEQESIALHYFSIIYEIVDKIKASLFGMLAPQFKEEIMGLAEVRNVFRSPKLGAIAGCMVTEGTIQRNKPIRVLRNNVVIYEGSLESLRRFKDDTNEVKQGFECGIGVKNYNDIKVGDLIEVFDTVQIQRSL